MIFGMITALSAVAAAVITIYNGDFGGLGFLWLMAGSFAGVFLGLTLLTGLSLVLVSFCVDLNKPQEKDSKFYRTTLYPYANFLKTAVRMRIYTEGLEKTPKDGRFLLVCNHQNESDPGVLHVCFPKSQLAFISKKEAKNTFVIGAFMHKTLCQMIDRENDREALKTILKCIQLIKDDVVSVGVFPEGGIKEEFKLNPFRPGVFKIAQKANVPIVVCTIQGTTDLFRNMKRLKPTDVYLHLVDVIPAEELKGVTTVEIAERVHKLMADDLGPDWALEEE